MSETNLTIGQLTEATAVGDDDLLLLRSGGQDYKLPVSTLAIELLSDESGAGRVGISPISGLYGDTVQEALEELYDRDVSVVTAFPIYGQVQEVVTTSDDMVVPSEDGIGSIAIPLIRWEPGVCVDLEFEFLIEPYAYADPDEPDSSYVDLIPTFGYDTLGDPYRLELPDSFSSIRGRGVFRLMYKSGSVESPVFHTRMEVKTVHAGSAQNAVTLHAVKFSEVTTSDISSGNLGLLVEFENAYGEISFTLKNARVIWQPAPQALT